MLIFVDTSDGVIASIVSKLKGIKLYLLLLFRKVQVSELCIRVEGLLLALVVYL